MGRSGGTCDYVCTSRQIQASIGEALHPKATRTTPIVCGPNLSTYQTSGQFDTAMQEWHARLPTNKSFPKIRVYIQNEYMKQVKRNRSTAGSVQKGIANTATEDGISGIEAQAVMIAEVANAMHE